MSSHGPATAQAVLERLKLTPGLSSLTAPRRHVATGLPGLDMLLGGGLPCAVTELVGACSSGRTALALALAATVTRTGALVACVDLPDAFDPEYAAAAGVRLPQLLWVRPQSVRAALRVTEHVVAAGGFRLVLLDVDTPHEDRGRGVGRAPAVWLRLARTATRSGTAIVILGAERLVGTFAALRLEVARRRTSFSRQDGPCPLFHGLDGRVHVRKSRQISLPATGPATGARLVVPAVA